MTTLTATRPATLTTSHNGDAAELWIGAARIDRQWLSPVAWGTLVRTLTLGEPVVRNRAAAPLTIPAYDESDIEARRHAVETVDTLALARALVAARELLMGDAGTIVLPGEDGPVTRRRDRRDNPPLAEMAALIRAAGITEAHLPPSWLIGFGTWLRVAEVRRPGEDAALTVARAMAEELRRGHGPRDWRGSVAAAARGFSAH